ncbi:Serine/Threonine-Protein Kinase 17B [Manis pentadactyla]|nr:Serine/Threonine-Protein Kinase 17B [Manis pentadactyla]
MPGLTMVSLQHQSQSTLKVEWCHQMPIDTCCLQQGPQSQAWIGGTEGLKGRPLGYPEAWEIQDLFQPQERSDTGLCQVRTSSEKSWGSAARLGHPGSGQTGEQVCLLQEEEGCRRQLAGYP